MKPCNFGPPRIPPLNPDDSASWRSIPSDVFDTLSTRFLSIAVEGFSPQASGYLLCFDRMGLRHASLHLTSQVRNDAEQSLDQHQLTSVVHLVLFD